MDTTTTTTEPFPSPSPSVLETIYIQIKTYPFSSDPEFQSGLRAILSTNPLTSPEIRTRTLQAQCFYISRKNNIIPPVDVEGYVNWLRQSGEKLYVPSEKKEAEQVEEEEEEKEEEEGGGKGGGGGDDDDVKTLSANDISPAGTAPITTTAATAPHEPQTIFSSSVTSTRTEALPPPPPPYPQSFSHLVELITTGQPIPGIKEVPDTLLTGQGSKTVESKRRKPWEVNREVEMEMERNCAGGADGVAR